MNPDTFFNRGNVYLHRLEFVLAHADFDKALNLEKTNAKFYHGKGLCYQEEAETLAGVPGQRDLRAEENCVQCAISFFGEALSQDESFISSMFH